MYSHTLLLILAVVCTASAQAVTSGYVTRQYYVERTACTTPYSAQIFKVGVCTPPTPSFASYYSDSNTIEFVYSGCDRTMNVANYTANQCNTATDNSYIWTYSATLPTLQNNVHTYIIHDTNVTGCTGDVWYVEQIYNQCYNKVYGSQRSESYSCTGTAQVVSTCSDTACGNCTQTRSTLNNVCDANNHATTNCFVTGSTTGSASSASTTGSTQTATAATATGASTTGTAQTAGTATGASTDTTATGASTDASSTVTTGTSSAARIAASLGVAIFAVAALAM